MEILSHMILRALCVVHLCVLCSAVCGSARVCKCTSHKVDIKPAVIFGDSECLLVFRIKYRVVIDASKRYTLGICIELFEVYMPVINKLNLII